MRHLWITALALVLSACANSSTRSFVSTPVPDDIRTVTYSTETSAGSNTWQLTNNDLRIKFTSKRSDGRLLANQTKKLTPNDYNWVVYNLEQANFTQAKSTPTRRQSQGNETLTIITQADTYSYTQNSATLFPSGFQKVINLIPRLANVQ